MRQPVGELRRSQAVHTFGIGSSVDLPHFTATVLGLEDWAQPDWDPTSPANAIDEERLLALVRTFVGPQLKQLAGPPVTSDDSGDDLQPHGIPVRTFPHWARCPRCELLAPLDFGVFKLQSNPRRPDETHYVHENCSKASGTSPPVNPVRFVFACRNGHISDFPWKRYIQTSSQGCGGHSSACGPYRLQERGVSSEVADLWLRCDQCNASRPMTQAFGEEGPVNLGDCPRQHPHLGRVAADDTCDNGEPRAMLLGASNQWFPMIVSALSIPSSTGRLSTLIDAHWSMLQNIHDESELAVLRRVGQLQAFSQFSDADIWNAVESKRSGAGGAQPQSTHELKREEWNLLTDPDNAPRTGDFELKRRTVPTAFSTWIEEIVAVERLRVVKALTGFTRIDSPGDYADLSEIPDVQRVRLGRNPPDWIPAFEVRGEGIFIRLKESVLAEWRQDPTVTARESALRASHIAFRSTRGIDPADDGFDVARYALVHSLSHTLIRQFAIECGYSAASIQERIYASPAIGEHEPMCGVLLMTAAADSEGTLGGLVNLSRPELFVRHLSQALERARLCSSDPLCSEHEPDREGRDLHGAACHACSFVSETSCERGNKYLDRSLLVETIGAGIRPFFESALN